MARSGVRKRKRQSIKRHGISAVSGSEGTPCGVCLKPMGSGDKVYHRSGDCNYQVDKARSVISLYNWSKRVGKKRDPQRALEAKQLLNRLGYDVKLQA